MCLFASVAAVAQVALVAAARRLTVPRTLQLPTCALLPTSEQAHARHRAPRPQVAQPACRRNVEVQGGRQVGFGVGFVIWGVGPLLRTGIRFEVNSCPAGWVCSPLVAHAHLVVHTCALFWAAPPAAVSQGLLKRCIALLSCPRLQLVQDFGKGWRRSRGAARAQQPLLLVIWQQWAQGRIAAFVSRQRLPHAIAPCQRQRHAGQCEPSLAGAVRRLDCVLARVWKCSLRGLRVGGFPPDLVWGRPMGTLAIVSDLHANHQAEPPR